MESLVPAPILAASLYAFKKQAKEMFKAVYAFEDANPKIMFQVHTSLPRCVYWQDLSWKEKDGKLIMEFPYGVDTDIYPYAIEFSGDFVERRIADYQRQYDDAMARLSAHSI
ncbi:hypothetical protein D3C87_764750 [compost metagenome]